MLKRILSISFILISTISGMFFSLKGKYIHEQMLFNHVAPKIYKVTNRAEQGSGTGSEVRLSNGSNIVLTNRHVCEVRDADDMLTLIDHKGVRHLRKMIKNDTQHDLCAIEGVDKSGPALKIAKKALAISDHVFVIGHPRGRPTSLSYGMLVDLKFQATINYGTPRAGEQCWGTNINIDDILKSLGILDKNERDFLKILYGLPEFMCMKTLVSLMSTAPGEPGNSGSPVTNFYGEIVAVLFAGDSSPHMSILVPHEAIVKFLESLHSTESKPLANPDKKEPVGRNNADLLANSK